MNGAPALVVRWATIDQYSRATNFSISSSRSQTMPQRDRLHPAGRARARQLAPQHRREVEADEIVERAPGAIGVDQSLVDLARVAHRRGDRVLGDRVEHHPVDPLVLEDLLGLEYLVDVPGDRLAFAVGVGRQNDAVGALHRVGDLVEALGRLGVDLPAHGEVVLGVDRAVLGGEVAHVAERSVDVVVLAEILADRLDLGRQLDDDNLHALKSLNAFVSRRLSGGNGAAPAMAGQGAENG